MNMKQYHKSVREAEEKVIGELLAEDLLRTLGRIANKDAGVIKWVEHEIESELLRDGTSHRDQIIEEKMLHGLYEYMNSLFTSKMTA